MAKPFQTISVVPQVLLCVCSYPSLISYVFSQMGYFCQVPVLFIDDYKHFHLQSHVINPHWSLWFLVCKTTRVNVY